MLATVRLVNAVFYAHHGVMKEEHKIGGRYEVDVAMDGVFIDGRVQQPADYDLEVSAVHATGMQASVGVSNFSEITMHTGGGIEATFGATVSVANTTLQDNSIYSWGYGGPSVVFAWLNDAGAPAVAESYGTVWLGQGDYSFSPTLPNNTFEAYSSNAGPLYAYNHGDLFASEFYDPSEGHHNNWLFDQDGVAPGFATSKYYSDVDARYNWWGQPTGPNLAKTSVTTGSAFAYCPYLTDPFSGAASTCGGGNLSAPSASGDPISESKGTGSASPEEMEDHGLASTRLSLMRGEHAEALARLSGLFSDAEAEPDERRRGLGLAARLAARGPALESAAARGLLLAEAAPGRPDRPWALRALAVADAGQGRHADVLRIAEHLVAMGGEHAVAGHVVSALARAALDRPEEAAVAVVTAERLAPGDPDVAMARRVVSLWFGEAARISSSAQKRRSLGTC